MRNKVVKILSVAIFVVAAELLFANRVLAAEIFFGAKASDVAVGGKFEIGVYANTQGQSVNAVGGDIKFPAASFDLNGFYDGGSALPLWVKQPALSAPGTVSFAGVVPGGFNGAKEYLFSLILTAKQTGSATIAAGNEQILLNDGLGTAAAVSGAPLVLNIVAAGTAPPTFVPIADNTPPEPFAPALAKSSDVFNGKWFVTFVAQDKGAGVDHYEIREKPPAWSFASLLGAGRWVTVESPYLLHDQGLERVIEVKAVDRAGNARIVALAPSRPLPWYENYLAWLSFILLVLASAWYWSIVKKRVKHKA